MHAEAHIRCRRHTARKSTEPYAADYAKQTQFADPGEREHLQPGAR